MLLALFPLFFVGGPDYYSARSYKSLWSFGHLIFFFLLTALLLRKNSGVSQRGFAFQCIVTLCLTVVVGVGVEFIQAGLSREISVHDVWLDIVGSLMGLYCFSHLRQEVGRLVSSAIAIFLLLVVIVELMIVVDYWQDEKRMAAQFPLLADFEKKIELTRWSGNAKIYKSSSHISSGEFSLAIDTTLDQFSGVGMRYFVTDWRDYSDLVLDVFSGQSFDVSLTLKIYDGQHRKSDQLYADRFNKSFLLMPGWNTIVVSLKELESAPNNRTMDLSNIVGLHFFVTEQEKSYRFYLDNLRLQ